MIFLTILAVSMDAYVAGITTGASSGRLNTLKILYISSYSFTVPAICMGLASFMTIDATWLNAISACILILLGIKGLLPEKGAKNTLLHRQEKKEQNFAYSTMLGLSLSVDSALGATAFCNHPLALAVPFLLLTAQFGLMLLGQMTARLLGFAHIVSRVSNGMLIIVGLTRFL